MQGLGPKTPAGSTTHTPDPNQNKSFKDIALSKMNSLASIFFNTGTSSKVTSAPHTPADASGKGEVYKKSAADMIKAFLFGKPQNVSKEIRVEESKEEKFTRLEGTLKYAEEFPGSRTERVFFAHIRGELSEMANKNELDSFKSAHPDFMERYNKIEAKFNKEDADQKAARFEKRQAEGPGPSGMAAQAKAYEEWGKILEERKKEGG